MLEASCLEAQKTASRYSVEAGVRVVIAAAQAPYRRPPAVALDNTGLGKSLSALLTSQDSAGQSIE
jgi:hypothetical protein